MAFTALNNQPPVQPPPVQAPVPKPAPAPVVPIPHPHEVYAAFASNHELRKRVHAAIDQNPSQSTLFRDISVYILGQSSQPPAEPTTKKRKLGESNGAQNGTAAPSVPTSGAGDTLTSTSTKAFKSYTGVSFSIPQRKKFTLELVDNKDGGIRAIGATGNVEFALAWKDVDQVFCLPVPEKAKKQHNFIVIPVHGDGVNPVPEELKPSAPEPILWTFEEATGKNVVEGEDPGPGPMAGAIHHCLIQAGTGKEVIFPDADEFASAIPESHRKGEKAYHVKAHRGSKEGYLFFTAVGILYGFKKPLAFFDFAAVNSISYTAVLRNTFNLVITTQTQEIEFSMLDQENFAGINEYVQKHGLQDASMAAERRAKKLNVNPPADKGKENGAAAAGAQGEEEEEESELQKAERELQDQEDDEEEDDDFDPGSEGESEGEGSDSEDEEGGGGYDEGDTAEVEGEDEEMED
ncbi:Rtt106-domain-containing protein [Macroventuria anomochaeta]|uniref:Rtt106-domain-containing protein n=1 Tax=Macroventuria anomochaeta TaxID=301207 RepID=A0ACB6RVR4_9PLEO|nr:Rtt106-domain-containing protein [Macroventuria anomochaeta]KAF2625229.1 Rtt106-domain-containing protein [Macroventuria anomochaeta]